MSVRWTELVVDSYDPPAIAEFWRQVLGWELVEDEQEDGDVEIGPPDQDGPSLLFQIVPEGKKVKNRIHIDVRSFDTDQGAELDRLKALGAVEVDIGQGDESWVVLADPEGNEFCLLASRVA
jgi:predicted enzyme related to lactoylglutathione lyase